MDALLAPEVANLLQGAEVLGQHGVAHGQRLADRGELRLGNRGQRRHELQTGRRDEMLVEIRHQAFSRSITRPPTATTVTKASKASDSPRAWAAGSPR